MADLNTCIFTGRIGTDIELKTTTSGISTCSFRLAVERPKSKDAKDAETDWLDVVAWRKTAEFCSQYLSKGRKVIVECSARTRRWTDKEDKTHKVVEFVVSNVIPCDSKPSANATSVNAAARALQEEIAAAAASDDELPF